MLKHLLKAGVESKIKTRKRWGLHRKSCVHLLTVILGIPTCASSSGMTEQVLPISAFHGSKVIN